MMKTHNKLVRDRILEIIEQDGVAYESRILDEEEFKKQLLKKVVEEAQEVLDSNGNKDELVKELADLWEVIESIVKTFELDHEQIQEVKQHRHDLRGGFDNKIFLESTDE